MTSAEEYYDVVKEMGPGQLFYLVKGKEESDLIFDYVVVDTSKEAETINRLKRIMQLPGFIGFPGTPEFNAFIEDEVASSDNNSDI